MMLHENENNLQMRMPSDESAISTDAVNKFQQITNIANEEAFKDYGRRDTCIFTSFALADALRRMDYNSKVVRVTAKVYPTDPCLEGSILGGTATAPAGRRSAASPGMWRGHVVCVVDDRWLLDATLDSVNSPRLKATVAPIAIELDPNFWSESPGAPTYHTVDNYQVCHFLYHNQKGFMSRRRTQITMLRVSDAIVARCSDT